MVREYRVDDLEAVVELFQRSVREVASRDYSPAQISAWAAEAPDLRRGPGVCERAAYSFTSGMIRLRVSPELMTRDV